MKDFTIKDSVVLGYEGDNTDVVIPEGITWIADYAFKGHKTLRRIHIPDSVTDIGHLAFAGCENLEEITSLNMLDPYPSSCYCPRDDINRRGLEPTNRRIIFEDELFTIPVAFPKVRLNAAYRASWKIALTLGFLAHPELYGAYDLDKKGERYRGVCVYEEDMPYAKYAMMKKKVLLAYIFRHDRVEMLRFYAAKGGFANKTIREAFLIPAQNAGAEKCVQFVNDWIEDRIDLEPIVPREEKPSDLPGSLTAEEALHHWAYTVDYLPEPTIRLTGLKKDVNFNTINDPVTIPSQIDGITVGVLGMYVFHKYIFYYDYLPKPYGYSDIKYIIIGENIKKINCTLPASLIKLYVPQDSYAHKYALENGLNFQVI